MLVATCLLLLCVMLLPLATKLTKSRYARKINNQCTVMCYFERRNHLALRVMVASIQTATVTLTDKYHTKCPGSPGALG
jgi:hypothetical protein